ncbi:MAG: 50S ribosomal protein L3 [Clostridiales bacterium]|nr:50S ribosomal protein L3 [Clostridiales bacterium]
MKTILGKKIGMTQIFTEKGEAVPVTVVEAGPAIVTQVKNQDKDGYQAVQIGYGDVKISKVNKPLKGHFDKSNVEYKKYLTEFRVEDSSAYETGQKITVEDFEAGNKVDVTGTSKGKGTQGAIKRHGQARGPMAHGSKYHRGAGSLGGTSYPGRVFKGQTGSGRMGNETVTVQNVEVVKIIPDKNIMLLKGAVPGPKGALLRIQDAVKSQDR